MLVYIAATLISCLLAVWCEKRNTDALNAIDSKQRWGALVLCSLPLILVSAARFSPPDSLATGVYCIAESKRKRSSIIDALIFPSRVGINSATSRI